MMSRFFSTKKITMLLGLYIFIVSGCTTTPPKNVDNICDIFGEYQNWYWITKKTQREWGVPINVQMAIIHQESKFDAKAKPDRSKLLWVIPWRRPSSAYGYSQALQVTWDNYQKNSGKGGKRDDFSSASDFIGWYGYQANKKAKIDRSNAYELYLAYHEGINGYLQKTYLKKQWLVGVAHKVSSRAQKYRTQLSSCEKKFKKKWWNFL